jgi:outer membrane murein-binding lipoprotein Lpp
MMRVLFVVLVTTLLLTGTMAQAQEDKEVSAIHELANAFERVKEAASAMEKAEARGDEQAIERARTHHRMAQQEMEQNLANLARVEPEDVAAMRGAGMGWGQIAQELGLHPGVLGLGHYQKGTPSQFGSGGKGVGLGRGHGSGRGGGGHGGGRGGGGGHK